MVFLIIILCIKYEDSSLKCFNVDDEPQLLLELQIKVIASIFYP